MSEDGGVTNEAQPEDQTAEVQPPPARHGRTTRDMVLSLVVLLIPVAIIVAFVWARGGDDVVVIDPGPTIAEAQAAHAFPVAVPNGLSSGWKPISSQYTTSDNTLRIGYITPTGAAVQLVESSAPTDRMLISELGDDVRPTGVVAAGTAQWNSYELHNGQRAVVLPQRARTVIIVGNAQASELQQLAATLG
jgi:hypothetical protein